MSLILIFGIARKGKQSLAPTSGLNMAIELLRFDDFRFSLFFSQIELYSLNLVFLIGKLSLLFCASGDRFVAIRAIERANNPRRNDTKKAQLPHGELVADWRDSRFCTLF